MRQRFFSFIFSPARMAYNRVLLTVLVVLQWSCMTSAEQDAETGTLSYEPSFFAPYNPITALDIVDRVPGFRLERQDTFGEQEQVRGFGGAASDVLINGKRPSTKATPIEKILERYAAEDVIRVDLIRGATGSLDSSQASVVVNLILKERTGRGPAPWGLSLHFEDDHILPAGKVAFSSKRGSTAYTLGISLEKYNFEYGGPEVFTDFDGPDEHRDELVLNSNDTWTTNVDTETALSNGDILRLNAQVALTDNQGGENSYRYPEGVSDPDLILQRNYYEATDAEIGGDYEHKLNEQFRMNVISVVTRKTSEFDSHLTDTPFTGVTERSRYTSEADEGETIGRLEFDFNGWKNQTLQFGGEIVHNFLDSEALFVFDDGTGFQPVPLPGSTTRVEELRGEIFLKDSWILNSRINIDAGIAIELSEIEQTGDTDLVREFTYAKPSVAMTFSASKSTQWRFRLEKEVGQLNFNEFVSATNFDDDDLDLGNPDLEPEKTWVFEIAYERRFSTMGVIDITSYYNAIEDVEDLIPIGGIYESPGNIGDGKRWGLDINLSTGLEFMGIGDARFDFSYEWQDSSVTDPVTGGTRPLSGEKPWSLDVSLRKDFPGSRASFGIKYEDSEDSTAYGVDELVVQNYTPGLSAFYEKTLKSGTKIRLDASNLLKQGAHRERSVYVDSRSTGVLDFTENRIQHDNRYFTVSFSGAL